MKRCYWFNPFHKLRSTVARHRAIADTTRELEQSSDRALDDMGLSRSDIAAVARGSYRRD